MAKEESSLILAPICANKNFKENITPIKNNFNIRRNSQTKDSISKSIEVGSMKKIIQ